jgi:hypothetical protein
MCVWMRHASWFGSDEGATLPVPYRCPTKAGQNAGNSPLFDSSDLCSDDIKGVARDL